MCGNVSYIGPAEGGLKVLEALYLLEYRAPDSSGLAALDSLGELQVRRAVGSARALAAELASRPLGTAPGGPQRDAVVQRQGITPIVDLRGKSLESLYGGEATVSIGCFGSPPGETASTRHSSRVAGALSPQSPDLDRDLVRHVLRLIATQIAPVYDSDHSVREVLDTAVRPAHATWRDAWHAEVAANVAGLAFGAAVRHIQSTLPAVPADERGAVGTVTARALSQVVVGHGRWAMVGRVSVPNAHPISDHSGTRLICENGSHNASLMLETRAEQAGWWAAHAPAVPQPVHRCENTTEVLTFEWERARAQLDNNALPSETDRAFVAGLVAQDITDPEEQAARLAMWRLNEGNAHACTLYSRHRPGTLFATSHHKPLALIVREVYGTREVLVASDVNAGLMLWPGAVVDAAAAELTALHERLREERSSNGATQARIDALLDQFSVQVIFLDGDLHGGEALFARIENDGTGPQIVLSRYDGRPVVAEPVTLRLNPAMVGKRGFNTYTESHIDEIPDILDDLTRTYATPGAALAIDAPLNGEGDAAGPGINLPRLSARFQPDLGTLGRVVLIGEGSSWRDAVAAAPVFRALLPHVDIEVYRPVEVLNLGTQINPTTDLAVEISWSGTTDSLLKADQWLAEREVLRLAVTGRPQSDLARRVIRSAGVLDVRTGVEVSVATVKGYTAILFVLNLLAIRLAELRSQADLTSPLAQIRDNLTLLVPQHVRAVINDTGRRAAIAATARACAAFNKLAVIGSSPVEVEAELKIEELAQIVAANFDFHAPSLRGLIERAALVGDDRQRTLFVVNATTPHAWEPARVLVSYLDQLKVPAVVHCTPNPHLAQWQQMETIHVFQSPAAHSALQALIDAPFFFDFAVALAYARGLSPEEIDRPRSLAKSVTTTGAERRSKVEQRAAFRNIGFAEFNATPQAELAWDAAAHHPTRTALRATVALRSALAALTQPLPERFAIGGVRHLQIHTATEAIENGMLMAADAWETLHGIRLSVFRRFIDQPADTGHDPDALSLRIRRAGALLSVPDAQTLVLPADLSPLQEELLSAVYGIGLAVRMAREQGRDVEDWQAAIAQMPLLTAQMLSDDRLFESISAAMLPWVEAGYDKVQIIGGGNDHAGAQAMARALRTAGFMAEALYVDSAWHGPLATVGGDDADHDTLIVILATDPLFQAAALVDTQVYRTRNAPVLLVVPEGNANLRAVQDVDARAVLSVPAVPRPLVGIVLSVFAVRFAEALNLLWLALEDPNRSPVAALAGPALGD